MRPTRTRRRPKASVDGPPNRALLDLAPRGGCRAVGVAIDAGALLPHRFTLTCVDRSRPSAVCFLLP